MAGKPPYFPFYVNDFAADGKVEAMTTEEVGAYILLLCKAWMEEPPGTIPNDDTVLARWARLTVPRWMRIRKAVLAPFSKGDDGRLWQKRMMAEYGKFLKVSHSRQEVARAGWEKRKRDAIAMQLQCKQDAAPHPDASGLQMQNAYGAFDSDSDALVLGDRGAGEGAAKQFDLTAEGLAQEWCFYLTRRKAGAPRDSPIDVAVEMAELLRLGIRPEAIRNAITADNRDRSEPLWTFRDRLKAQAGMDPKKPPKRTEKEYLEERTKLWKEQKERLERHPAVPEVNSLADNFNAEGKGKAK